MTTVKDMLATYPAELGQVDRDKLTRCIEECLPVRGHGRRAHQVRPHRHGLRGHLQRHHVRAVPAHRLRRQHHPRDPHRVRTACKACADERSAHADQHEHCRLCAEACRSCEQPCNDLIQALG